MTKDSGSEQSAWERGLEAWREKCIAGLAGPYGWWSLTCLAWLEDGPNALGSGGDCAVPLDQRFPPVVATLRLTRDRLTIEPAGTAVLKVGDEVVAAPTTVEEGCTLIVRGPITAHVELVRRGGSWAARVRDPLMASAKDPTKDVAWFPPDPTWVLEAAFAPAEPGEEVAVSNVLGQVSMQPVAGRLTFAWGGAEHTLLATHGSGGGLFVSFRDASNEAPDDPSGRLATYSGGRYLNTGAPVDGRVVLDFNRAIHPPCAHTPYATCPVPTPGNALPFAVPVGEANPHPELVVAPSRLGSLTPTFEAGGLGLLGR